MLEIWLSVYLSTCLSLLSISLIYLIFRIYLIYLIYLLFSIVLIVSICFFLIYPNYYIYVVFLFYLIYLIFVCLSCLSYLSTYLPIASNLMQSNLILSCPSFYVPIHLSIHPSSSLYLSLSLSISLPMAYGYKHAQIHHVPRPFPMLPAGRWIPPWILGPCSAFGENQQAQTLVGKTPRFCHVKNGCKWIHIMEFTISKGGM